MTYTYTSTIYDMVTNPDHSRFEDKQFNSELPTWVMKGNTLYLLRGVYHRPLRNWLLENGIDVTNQTHYRVYTPVATVERGVVTGYVTEFANMGNRLLSMGESRKTMFPNLYWVDVGNHPYPTEGRFGHNWMTTEFNKECHRLVYPDNDPKKFFILPKDILPN